MRFFKEVFLLFYRFGFIFTKKNRNHGPETVLGMAIEELFFNTNVTTGIGVAQARGVILATAARLGVEIFEYTPSQVKIAVVGYGKAEKRQVMEMTRRILGLSAVPRPDDAADAVAIALCHARSRTSRLYPMESH